MVAAQDAVDKQCDLFLEGGFQIVEARTPSRRALATMTVDPGIGSTQLPSKEAGVDLSCGQLYLWTTAQEPIWPAPDSGSPGDCLP